LWVLWYRGTALRRYFAVAAATFFTVEGQKSFVRLVSVCEECFAVAVATILGKDVSFGSLPPNEYLLARPKRYQKRSHSTREWLG